MKIEIFHKHLLRARPFNRFQIILIDGYELPLITDPKFLRTLSDNTMVVDCLNGTAFVFELEKILYVRVHEVEPEPAFKYPVLSAEQAAAEHKKFPLTPTELKELVHAKS